MHQIYIKYAKETSNTLAMLRKHEELKKLYLWAQNKKGVMGGELQHVTSRYISKLDFCYCSCGPIWELFLFWYVYVKCVAILMATIK